MVDDGVFCYAFFHDFHSVYGWCFFTYVSMITIVFMAVDCVFFAYRSMVSRVFMVDGVFCYIPFHDYQSVNG